MTGSIATQVTIFRQDGTFNRQTGSCWIGVWGESCAWNRAGTTAMLDKEFTVTHGGFSPFTNYVGTVQISGNTCNDQNLACVSKQYSTGYTGKSATLGAEESWAPLFFFFGILIESSQIREEATACCT